MAADTPSRLRRGTIVVNIMSIPGPPFRSQVLRVAEVRRRTNAILQAGIEHGEDGSPILIGAWVFRPGRNDRSLGTLEPATTVAQRGDTLRFTEASGALHNVRFTKQAPGAKLGAASTTPYLTAKGQTYDVVVDQRFAAGTYEFVCDPHAAIGMKGTLVVQ